MNSSEEQIILETVNFIKDKTNINPKILVVLGSGLNEIIDIIEDKEVISYSDIPNFQKSTAIGHKGRLIFGYIDKAPVVFMQGRIHLYEGYNMIEVVRPIRALRLLGVDTVLLTNSSGGINEKINVGDLVIVKDHISSFVPNCLIGPNLSMFGERFPDMSSIYNESINKFIKEIATKCKIKTHEGVYLQTSGPSFESPAEIKMYQMLGADVVGMSTTCEAIAAAHMGMNVSCISNVSNIASGLTDKKQSINDIYENVCLIESKFKFIIKETINYVIGDGCNENKVL